MSAVCQSCGSVVGWGQAVVVPPAEVDALRAANTARQRMLEQAECDVTTLRARVAKLEDAAADMLAGWRYIRRIHGDLPGIGWDRAQQAVEAALGTAAPMPLAPLSAEEQRQARAALSPATEAAPE